MGGAAPFSCPVGIAIDVSLGVPSSWSKAKRKRALESTLPAASRPDLDNVLKAVMDAMRGIVFNDDKQVVGITALKRYGETPQVTVNVMR
jgi:Holliday junction resolvase RusA-like endonuclease